MANIRKNEDSVKLKQQHIGQFMSLLAGEKKMSQKQIARHVSVQIMKNMPTDNRKMFTVGNGQEDISPVVIDCFYNDNDCSKCSDSKNDSKCVNYLKAKQWITEIYIKAKSGSTKGYDSKAYQLIKNNGEIFPLNCYISHEQIGDYYKGATQIAAPILEAFCQILGYSIDAFLEHLHEKGFMTSLASIDLSAMKRTPDQINYKANSVSYLAYSDVTHERNSDADISDIWIGLSEEFLPLEFSPIESEFRDVIHIGLGKSISYKYFIPASTKKDLVRSFWAACNNSLLLEFYNLPNDIYLPPGGFSIYNPNDSSKIMCYEGHQFTGMTNIQGFQLPKERARILVTKLSAVIKKNDVFALED